jgi:hypothetical protein
MTDENTAQANDGKKKRKRPWWLLLLLFLALLLLFIAGLLMLRSRILRVRGPRDITAGRRAPWAGHPGVPDTAVSTGTAAANAADTAADTVSVPLPPSAAPRVKRTDTARSGSAGKPAGGTGADTAAAAPAADSLAQAAVPVEPCDIDTVAPWIFPDPSGGLHRRHVTVRLLSVEQCDVSWRYGNETVWRPYSGEPILITRDTSIVFTAVDTCGNISPPRAENYTITSPLTDRRCPDGMEFVKVHDTEFCIDRFEWPNLRDRRPSSFVSIYQARDSCFTKGRRLCSTDEWTLACAGAQSWHYPYGGVYEPRACNTQDTSVVRSGAFVECRGFFDIYDMSGNLAEWTNTPSSRNRRFFNVMGGFFNSGQEANCFTRRYSYFPQNRHNPVGFRCCRDADTVSQTKQ